MHADDGLSYDGPTHDAPTYDGDVTTRSSEHEALANVHAVLQLCAGGALRCSEKTRRPDANSVVAVAKVLLGGDFYPDQSIAAFAWPLLIQAGGLAELAGGRLQLTARGRGALAKPAAQTVKQLWTKWVSQTIVDELSRVDNIKGQRSANVLTSAKARRQIVAQALAGCPMGDWVRVDDLFAWMRREGMSPQVARSERALWKLYLDEQRYGSLGYAGFGDWPILEGRYTLAVLFEYAGTLGLFDLAYRDPAGARDDFRGNWGTEDLDYLSRYDGLLAVRLNDLGAYVLGVATDYQPAQLAPAGRTFKVLANRDIVAVGELQPADRMLLSAYAEQTADHVWTLSTASLLAAVDDGRPLDQLRRFLRDRAQPDLPVTVTALLDEITARTTRITDLGPCRVIECADAPIAALIATDRKLRDLCRPLGDRHIAIPAEHDLAFRKALRKVGYVLPTG
jgi:hypothetical protein